MYEFIRKIYLSELSEASEYYPLPTKARIAAAEYERLLEELKNSLNVESLAILEQYIGDINEIHFEEEFHSFLCGMRFMSRLASEIISNG